MPSSKRDELFRALVDDSARGAPPIFRPPPLELYRAVDAHYLYAPHSPSLHFLYWDARRLGDVVFSTDAMTIIYSHSHIFIGILSGGGFAGQSRELTLFSLKLSPMMSPISGKWVSSYWRRKATCPIIAIISRGGFYRGDGQLSNAHFTGSTTSPHEGR